MKNQIKYYLAFVVSLLAVTYVFASQQHDQDYDGVADDVDQCLSTPALRKVNTTSKYAALFSKAEISAEPISVPVDARGCVLDSDFDAVPDYQDYCPDNTKLEISAGVAKNGCPRHSDSDGTPDYRDQCPGTAKGVKSDRFGCPV